MADPVEALIATAEGTRGLGEAIGGLLRPRDVVSLAGELGAGKTTFVQGAAMALGVKEPVLSPTFTLVREYEGRALRVHHVDIYRLDRLQDVLDLGFEEMLDEDSVVFVEWGDAIQTLLPDDHLRVTLSIPESHPGRHLAISARGRSWDQRWARLAEAVAAAASARGP